MNMKKIAGTAFIFLIRSIMEKELSALKTMNIVVVCLRQE